MNNNFDAYVATSEDKTEMLVNPQRLVDGQLEIHTDVSGPNIAQSNASTII